MYFADQTVSEFRKTKLEMANETHCNLQVATSRPLLFSLWRTKGAQYSTTHNKRTRWRNLPISLGSPVRIFTAKRRTRRKSSCLLSTHTHAHAGGRRTDSLVQPLLLQTANAHMNFAPPPHQVVCVSVCVRGGGGGHFNYFDSFLLQFHRYYTTLRPLAAMDSQSVNQEYLEFIKVTRQHQAAREKQKKLQLKKNPQLALDEYYIDISQVNTLVEDNLVEAPARGEDISKLKKKEEDLVKLYGSREAYERIRSLEMSIDDHFKRECQELSPYYWPVIPINPKPYLNPLR